MENIRAEDPGFFTLFNADAPEFDGLERQSNQILKLLLERVQNWNTYPSHPSCYL